MKDIFEGWDWHSSVGIDNVLSDSKKYVKRLPNVRKAKSMFVMAGRGLLVHKATRALWRVSDDGSSIEPVFDSDVLTEEDIEELEDDELEKNS